MTSATKTTTHAEIARMLEFKKRAAVLAKFLTSYVDASNYYFS